MKKILAVTFIAITCAFTNPPKELQLHYVFKKGESFEWTQTIMQTQHILVAGQEQNVENGIKGATLMKTIEASATKAKFEIEYTSISMKLKSPMGEIAMDSEGDTTTLNNKILNKMKGKKFTFTLSKYGIVESVDGIESLWSGLAKMADPQAAQTKAQIEKQFGKAAFKRSIESALVFYPEQKIQAGSTWKNTIAGSAELPVQTDNVWTLESVTEPTAVVISDGAITTTDTTKVIPMMGAFRATANLKGRQVAKSTVSTAQGWPQTCKLYSELKGRMTLLAGGQIPEDMPMKMEITTEAEYTLKKK